MKLELFEVTARPNVWNWCFKTKEGTVIATGKPQRGLAECKRRLIDFLKRVQADDFDVYLLSSHEATAKRKRRG